MKSALIIGILQLIIREAPEAITGIRDVINKENPTDEDFAAAILQIERDTFEKVAPNAAGFRGDVPPEAPNAANPPAPTP